ncbi:type IV secretion protein [Renibacterium salmoninarum ATCC 33209]|uniref:Type IV secretion protein n=1 Tax=Renibacterium salmoninarum (strain ATCC 33209 / DSM 20767 / JCM 11484 / NBRC 15589 / NCIMB 2235) TaxID=288705 RepID=A9WP77_RENSM|nr:hypothetical protein [Renibacterium salmoninarum]ABY22852.1 type IV secretion protein [Renibacterium salmoninarum ATCC 33209]
MAEFFNKTGQELGSRGDDPFFAAAAVDLLSDMFLAANVTGQGLGTVFGWLTSFEAAEEAEVALKTFNYGSAKQAVGK